MLSVICRSFMLCDLGKYYLHVLCTLAPRDASELPCGEKKWRPIFHGWVTRSPRQRTLWSVRYIWLTGAGVVVETGPWDSLKTSGCIQTCHMIRITRILAGFYVIRSLSLLIRILTKLMETLFLTTLCPCMRHKPIEQRQTNRLLLVTK